MHPGCTPLHRGCNPTHQVWKDKLDAEVAAAQHTLDAEEAAALQGKLSVAEAAREVVRAEEEARHASQALEESCS